MNVDYGELTFQWVSSPYAWVARWLFPLTFFAPIYYSTIEPTRESVFGLSALFALQFWLWLRFALCFDVQIQGDTLHLKRGYEKFTLDLHSTVDLKWLGFITRPSRGHGSTGLLGRKHVPEEPDLLLRGESAYRGYFELRWRGQETSRHSIRFYHPGRWSSSRSRFQPGLRRLIQRLIELDAEKIEERLAANKKGEGKLRD